MSQECDKLRKQIDDLDTDKERLQLEIEKLKSDVDLVRKENQGLHLKLKEISIMYSNSLKLNSGLTNTLQNLKKQQKNKPVSRHILWGTKRGFYVLISNDTICSVWSKYIFTIFS